MLTMFLCQNLRISSEIHCGKSVQMRSFFWFVFSCIRIKYEDLLRKSPYSVQIRENTNQEKLRFGQFSHRKFFFLNITVKSLQKVFLRKYTIICSDRILNTPLLTIAKISCKSAENPSSFTKWISFLNAAQIEQKAAVTKFLKYSRDTKI